MLTTPSPLVGRSAMAPGTGPTALLARAEVVRARRYVRPQPRGWLIAGFEAQTVAASVAALRASKPDVGREMPTAPTSTSPRGMRVSTTCRVGPPALLELVSNTLLRLAPQTVRTGELAVSAGAPGDEGRALLAFFAVLKSRGSSEVVTTRSPTCGEALRRSQFGASAELRHPR